MRFGKIDTERLEARPEVVGTDIFEYGGLLADRGHMYGLDIVTLGESSGSLILNISPLRRHSLPPFYVAQGGNVDEGRLT